MAKKKKKGGGSGGPKGPMDRLHAVIEAGDNREARKLAQQIADDAEAPEEQREEARKIAKGLKIEPVALAYVIGGLVLWTVVFILGVLARR